MTLQLDTRPPILVVIAQFNPAIFTMPWVAANLHGIAPGTQVELFEVVGQVGSVQLSLSFLEGVAIKMTADRTDIFVAEATPDVYRRAEQLLLKMIEILPHTPLQAIGCNINFVDEEPPELIVDLFNTAEGLEADVALSQRSFGAQFPLEDGSVLNLSRTLAGQSARFSFNFHRSETDAAAFPQIVDGLIEKSIGHATQLLIDRYEYKEYETLSFKLLTGEYGEEEKHGDEGTDGTL